MTSTIPMLRSLFILTPLNSFSKKVSKGALLYKPPSKKSPLAIPPNQFLYKVLCVASFQNYSILSAADASYPF